MSKAYEFLKECGSFFVLTINGDYPEGKPAVWFASTQQRRNGL